MTTTQTAPEPTIAEPQQDRIPFTRLVRAELRKLVDTRSGTWLLIAIGVITLAAVVIFLFAADSSALNYWDFIATTATPQGLLLPVLGILAITSEWSQRTGLVTFTLEPNRSRVVGSKFTALIVFAVAFVALALALAVIGNLLGMALQGGSGDWSIGVAGFRNVLLLQLIGVVQGFAFGMLFMNSAAAIVVFFAVPIASSMVFNMVTWLRENLAQWIDLGTAETPLQTLDMAGNDWAQLGVACLIWVVVPFAIGLYRLMRAEVKSA